VIRPITSGPALREEQRNAGTRIEEALVADSRAGVTPAEMVERKLAGLLKTNPLLISQAQLRGGFRGRRLAEG
jgi:hypothetical protein